MYTYNDGSTWQFQTVDSLGAPGEYSSPALDAAGRPRIRCSPLPLRH